MKRSTSRGAVSLEVPASMRAMVAGPVPGQLTATTRPVPAPGPREVLVRVLACGVCRTDLHVIDRELPPHRNDVVPGHEVAGEVVSLGADATRFAPGQRVGIPWLGLACGTCAHCRARRENLCDAPAFTGWDRDGGYAEYCVADERFCFALPPDLDPVHAAPLLCAGLIGFRSWRLAGGSEPQALGLWGFGAAAHIVCQIARAKGQLVHAFTRPGDAEGQAFAREMGAAWAGSSADPAPRELDASILFAPDGTLVPKALAACRKGGVVVCAGIHMSDIPAFPYRLLWGERALRSVANLTREDGDAFFQLLRDVRIRTQVQAFPLHEAPRAIDALRAGRVKGAAVLVP